VIVPTITKSLRWLGVSVAAVMHEHGIRDRSELAATGPLPRATVYRNFDENWEGRVSSPDVLAILADHFGVLLNQLVIEPGLDRLQRRAERLRRRNVRASKGVAK
jgi:hypothetical protein